MKQGWLRRLWRFLRPHAPALAAAAALAAASGLLALLVPLFSGWAVGAVGTEAGRVDLGRVALWCAGAALAAALSALFAYGAAAVLTRAAQAVSYELRKAAFRRISELPVQYFDTHPAGDLISRVCYDVDTVNAALSTDLLQIGTSVLTVAGSFVMLLLLSPSLAGVFFVTVPLSAALTWLQMKRIHPLYRLRSRGLGELNGFVEERVGCQRAVRLYQVEEADLAQFAVKNEDASRAYYRADCAGAALGPSVNFINNLSLAAISVFGALMYLSGTLSLAALSSFVLYSRKFSGPIRATAELLSDLQASAAATERVLDLLDQPPEAGDLPGAGSPAPSPETSPSAMWTLDMTPRTRCCGISAWISRPAAWWPWWVPPGPARPPWCPSCCGSMRRREASSPSTGLPLDRYTRDGLRRRLAIVLQDSWLCGGTIAENIAYGVPGAHPGPGGGGRQSRLHPRLSRLAPPGL